MKQVYQSRSIKAIVIGIVCILIPLTDCKKFEPERIDPDDLYTVTINNVSNVTYNSCTLNGELVTMKGQNITQHGFCWSESNNPTIENGDKNELGSRTSTGSFSSTISDLTTNTTYYARAYVTDKYAGTAYGEEKSFTTNALSVPTVLTSPISNVTESSAKSGGEVTSDGGSTITARGVCWSTSENPDVSDTHTNDSTGTGEFTSSILGLVPSTKYYVRAYATNNQGTGYGNQLSLTTQSPSDTVTDYDGNVYNSVQIGEQVWMQENLKVTHYSDGTPIPLVEDQTAWDALGYTDKAYCWNENSTTNRDIYGGLYTWAAAMNGGGSSSANPSGVQGVCPAGWHLPSDAEWTELIDFLGGSFVAGGKLKETGLSHWGDPNAGATNESGFTALPGGTRSSSGVFNIKYSGRWWSTLESTADRAWDRGLSYSNASVNRSSVNRDRGLSVRCIKDGGSLSLPTVSTKTIINITESSAESGGEVMDDGGDPVTDRGVCWSTSENPTIDNDTTVDGNGTGTFTSLITGLDCNTTYYVKAYATNSAGTAYGDQEEFTTSQCSVVNPPTVTTTYISNITSTSAEGGGEVVDDGGGPITARGVCWSTSQNPTTSDLTSDDGVGIGSFTSNISGLTKSTIYYVRAFATNSAETSYGDEVILRTYEETITDYDGNEYWTVIIGDQKWMAENLMVTHYADGSEIPLVETGWLAVTFSNKAYCWYDNNTSNGEIYGALYSWATAMNGSVSSNTKPSGIQGVCPDGWHLPSDEEWKDLEIHLGMNQTEANNLGWRGTTEGGIMKETGTVHWNSPNTGATNESGFTARPGGDRSSAGTFYDIGRTTFFWTTTENDTSTALYRHLRYNETGVLRDFEGSAKDCGFSVRCVEGQGYSVPTVTTSEPSNIKDNSADAGGNVTDDGGQTVIEKGVCYSTDPNPTIDDDNTFDGSGIGSFSSSISGLTPDTIYYIRAYASNGVGTGYGDEVSFATLASSITDYDGNTYQIVAIGNQVWMAENLKVKHYHDGTVIPLVEDNLVWDGLDNTEKAYCWYDNNDTLGIIHGALYNWAGAMNGAGSSDTNPSGVQGVCPAGWHLPSDAEWTQLIDYLGGETIAAGKMKESGFEHWNSPNTGATNESGFTALASGYRFYGEFYDMGGYTNFWTAMESTSTKAWTRFLYYDSAGLQRTLAEKRGGLSVRCVKNE